MHRKKAHTRHHRNIKAINLSMDHIQFSDLLCCSVSSRDVLLVRLEKLPTMADFDQEQHVQEALRYLDQKDVKKVLRDLTESLLLRQPENPRVHMLEELWESTGRSWTPFAENIPCSFLEQKFPSPREAVGDMLRRAAGAVGVRRVSFFSAPNCRGRSVLGRGDAARFSGSDFLLVDSSDADLAVGQPGGVGGIYVGQPGGGRLILQLDSLAGHAALHDCPSPCACRMLEEKSGEVMPNISFFSNADHRLNQHLWLYRDLNLWLEGYDMPRPVTFQGLELALTAGYAVVQHAVAALGRTRGLP